MSSPKAGCLDASMDTSSIHSIKTRPDDSTQVMTSVSPIPLDLDTPSTERHGRDVHLAPYRMYKRRFVGLVALVSLNFVGGMSNPWFGPIASNMGRDFGFSLDKVNWLGNVVNFTYLPFSVIIPLICTRYGIRATCNFGAFFLLISAWIRYAGTARSLTEDGAYGLVVTGQILSGIAQPAFQVIGPLYSETWFDLKGRTTVTMILSISNPVGGAIAQIISPSVDNTRTSILIMGIIATAVVPLVSFISNAPPTPPTHAAARKNPPFMSLIRALLGVESPASEAYMSYRERADFAVIVLVFGVFVGVVTSFTLLTDEDFGPYGYSSDISGLMGATLLLSGLVAAAITAPLFDRVFTHHLAVTCKIVCPILGGMWLSLIWATRRNNEGGLFAIMAIIGACSVTILPVSLELAMEVTRNGSSSAICWFAGNLFSITCVLVEGALRAGPDDIPPNNMHRSLVYQGSLVCSAAVFIFLLRGNQKRRELDERLSEEAKQGIHMDMTSP